MEEPIITIIIPTYKPENYLKDCLKSLSDQIFENEKYEVLIILNGEKEPYFSFILNTIKDLNNKHFFRLVYSAEKGVSSARNLGLAQANGKFVCFVDDDDMVVPRYLEGLYNTITRNGEELSSLAISNVRTSTGGVLGKDYLGRSFEKCKNIKNKNGVLEFRSFFSVVWGKLIPIDVLKGLYFDPNLYIGEDSLFMFELSKRIKFIELAQENIVYIRAVRQGSVLRTKRSFKEELNIITMLSWKYTKAYIKNPIKYNFFFFVSRLIAVFKRFFKISSS